MRRPASLRPAALWPVALLLAAALLASPAEAIRFPQGEKIQFTGVVTDRQGTPLEGVSVVLEVTRSTFSLRSLRNEPKESRRISTTTTAGGSFTLDWPWDNYFNRFEVLVGVPVRKPGGERLAVLSRLDVTDRLRGGSPVVATVVVENRKFVDTLRAFVASLKSADERRVYEELGKPDEVKRVVSGSSSEASWWYFDLGKMYRFENGRLAEVVPFEPVAGFTPSNP